MSVVNINERSWGIDLISCINEFIADKEFVIKRAGGENSLKSAHNTMFPDVLLFGDSQSAKILLGWELKMPDTDINDEEFIKNAFNKAKLLKLNSFLLWNVNYAKLYVIEDENLKIEMDFYKGEPYMIRRSRGYAPLPMMVTMPWKGQVLAAGGELKNTFCIGVDGRFYLSPYVGDLEDLRTVKALQETIHRFETLLEVEPEVAACDLHPKYNSTVVAEELGLPVVKIQHHYAHILSCMVENDCPERAGDRRGIRRNRIWYRWNHLGRRTSACRLSRI